MIAPYDCLCQECVGSCSFCSDDSRNLTASLWNFYYLLHISMHLSYCLLQTYQGFLRWHWCMLFSPCCSWFRSLPSPSPFWAQRCFTVLFDDFTWFAMVSSQVPFLSQDWETWKTMPHIDASEKPEVAEVSCENTCTCARMRRSKQKWGVTFSDVYLVPSSIVQKNGITLIDQKMIHHEFWKYPTSYCCSISLFVYIFSPCTMGQGDLSLDVDDADKFVSLPGVKTAMQQAGHGNHIQISWISIFSANTNYI